MGRHVIVGAGAVGRGVARLLAADGHEAVIVSRSGRAPAGADVRAVAADATDERALADIARGADVIYNCANPGDYHRWDRDWPPLAAAILGAAEQTGAALAITGNLYGYGPVDGPMTAETPLAATGKKGRIRRQMWIDALAAHDAGRVRVTEVRASDYVGPESGAQSHLGDREIPRLLAGKRVRVIGSPDVEHSWTYVPDVSRTLVTVAAGDRAWGRAWLVPSNPPMTHREALESIADRAGVAAPRVSSLPRGALRAVGVVSPMVRELDEVLHQFERPFVIDASDTTALFGIEPTPWSEVVESVLEAYRAPTRQGETQVVA